MPYTKALIVVNENSQAFISNSHFEENYSISRGSVLMADYQRSHNFLNNCTIINNAASVGGVFYSQFDSSITCV